MYILCNTTECYITFISTQPEGEVAYTGFHLEKLSKGGKS